MSSYTDIEPEAIEPIIVHWWGQHTKYADAEWYKGFIVEVTDILNDYINAVEDDCEYDIKVLQNEVEQAKGELYDTEHELENQRQEYDELWGDNSLLQDDHNTLRAAYEEMKVLAEDVIYELSMHDQSTADSYAKDFKKVSDD